MSNTQEYPLYYSYKSPVLSNDEAFDAFLKVISEKKLDLYPAQEEAILELYAGHNVILNTPTGSGKSLVALALHYKSLTSRRRSIYTCPIKALVNEKFFALCKEFGPFHVGMMTGDASVNTEAPILCCTAEVLANMALRKGELANIHDIVIDEFHYYADRDRGSAWQIPLLTLKHCRFLLMSATFGATEGFARNLTELTSQKTVVVSSKDRPVPLKFTYSETPLEQAILELITQDKAPVYVVNFSQRECAEVAQNLLSSNFCSKEEKLKIAEAIQEVSFSSPYGKEIKKFLRHGIGLHHAGLLPKYRILVENLAQKSLLKVICGTDTLGVGVNVPIRTVLFTKLCKFDGQKTIQLTARDFHQISGRAGRKGFDSQGFVVAQAPEHVIENIKLAQKALLNPSKKFVKAKPPEKGFIAWNQESYQKLIEAPPEELRSSFQINHGMLLNVLARDSDGCDAMRQLIRNCHESDKVKHHLRKLSFLLFRTLLDKKIIEIIPLYERQQRSKKLRVNVDLQDDFSLNQTLSLFLLDCINQLDPYKESFPLELLSLVESILENPTPILLRQLDRVKKDKLSDLKAQGMDFDDRMNELEKLEYPKPMAEFIYNSFNHYASQHPWVGESHIRPKSIAREMYENFDSFGDYIRKYDLQRVEGLLLRYVTDTYRVLSQTVPNALKNDEIDEMVVYFEQMIKTTDSSLLEEWLRLQHQKLKFAPSSSNVTSEEKPKLDMTQALRLLGIHIRNTVFSLIRALASKNYEEALTWIQNQDQEWNEDKLDKIMKLYYEDHSYILTTSSARSPKHITMSSLKKSPIQVEAVIIDADGHNDWIMELRIDVDTLDNGELLPKYYLLGIRDIA